jgi:hypothetical protein
MFGVRQYRVGTRNAGVLIYCGMIMLVRIPFELLLVEWIVILAGFVDEYRARNLDPRSS